MLARTRLGAQACDQARAEGDAMGLEDATACALTREQPTAAVTRKTSATGGLTQREREVASLVANAASLRVS